ncbi:MAG: TRAP transporter small permease [Deltaproteobacteria bacterium]|nr:TRAP transporter small permease [Deltaproteobacteria bacterium]MBW2308761.1 TRAP transporter small permease [Deltaproteobacteria bacterium]
MLAVKWIDEQLSRLEKAFLAGSIIFASLLLFINVIMRYVFLHAIFWAEELVRYMMVWVIFIGASQVAKRGGHIAVDIFPRMISKRANTALSFFVTIFALLFCVLLVYYSFGQVMRVKAAHQISPAMELPMWIAYLSIPVGSSLMLIRYIQQFCLLIQGTKTEVEEILD